MRTLALLLLLINMAFFAWQQQLLTWLPWQPEQFLPAPETPPHSNLPQLVLLSEREAANRPVPTEAPVVASKPKEVVEVKVESPVTAPVKSATLPLHALEPISPSTPEKLHSLVINSPTVTPPAASPVTEPPPVVTEPEPRSFRKLALMMIATGQVTTPSAISAESELNPSEKSSQEPSVNPSVPESTAPIVATNSDKNTPVPAAKTEQPTVITTNSDSSSDKSLAIPDPATDTTKTLLSVPPTKTNKTEVVCYQIGDFSQQEAVNAGIQWFKKKQVTATSQKSDTRLATTTWIYLPPVRSLQLAQTTQQKLKRLGVKDTDIIAKNGENTVSLGVYRDKLGITRRLQELRSKGFNDVRTEEHYATETKYWLSVKIAPNQAALLSQFQKVFKGLRTTTVVCK